MKWCPEADSNHRHKDFQSFALPTELPGHKVTYVDREKSYKCPENYYPNLKAETVTE